MPNLSFSDTLMPLFILILFLGFLLFFYYVLMQKLNKKKVELKNNAACKKILKAHRWKLLTDYFWSNYMRFAWIMLFFTFFMSLGFALKLTWSIIFSLLLIIPIFYFLRFSIKSYKSFPSLAEKQLKKFEEEVKSAITNEISFKGDNIEVFSKKDDSFDTEPQLFSFPTGITKIAFPPFEQNAGKQPIISTRKLEFLVLSREYFSICQSAATFNLLSPERAGPPKHCAELPGRAGECHEHYYSQMRNVEYDDKKECIRIIYYDKRDDVEFPCKKAHPDRKAAMNALQEKLRLTERQRLQKIDEHEKYEEILKRRNAHIDSQNSSDSKEED
ncbi:MAG: Unknown protein [uncultured Sulfurovum sp.]|uniref:Uncharacterized protein n=1 Tax=uncultured Sulfurovum sp. TaxID=269237 RepID=A0A6S6T768_9BACT|nr:MAG: Unknown protein [uncultured Sulfurovum sp.]